MSRRRALQIVFAIVGVIVVAIGLRTLALKLVPNYLAYPRTSRGQVIAMALEQLDSAKLMLATNRHLSEATVPTHDELQPYLVSDFWRWESKLGVTFHINAIGRPAEAVVTKRFDNPRGGTLLPKTIIRWSTNLHGYEVVQPGSSPERK